MRTLARAAVAVAIAIPLMLSTTACSQDAGGGDEAEATVVDKDVAVTLTVSNMPPAGEAEALALWDERVAQFEDANPGITIEGVETAWDPTTFGAQLAGGTLPTVLLLPFTELQGLIAREQIAYITDALEETGLTDVLNPATLAVAQNADGRIFAVPFAAYAVGLVYNRDLFERAGLDPDVPPTTWDEVREYAAQITAATGVAGFGQMTSKTSGGWQFTAETYSFGGTMQSADGKDVTFNDNPAAAEFLQLLHDMRWEDQSMGSEFLYDGEEIQAAFAAGNMGMWIGAPDAYRGVVLRNKFDPEKFGAGPMPRGTEGDDFGVMAGGNSAVVSPLATPEEQLAAVKWIEFYHLAKYVDEDAAVADAQAQIALGKAVGMPGLTAMTDEAYARYEGWIADYVNVPLENFEPYMEALPGQPLMTEPINKAQDMYFALSTVIQTVLTDQNASMDGVLSEAASTLQSQLDRG